MKCLLVFDHLNDIVFSKFNEEFENHIINFASDHGILSEDNTDKVIGSDIIIQIFSPIITSHRIMNCQFGNTYTSIQFQENLNIVFDEYMGYLFVSIANEKMLPLKKYLNFCVTVARYLCGPDVVQLKASEGKALLAKKLLDKWSLLCSEDQVVLVEAIEQLVVNREVGSSTLETLQETCSKMANLTDCPRLHALLLVQNKILSLYSSEQAKELSASDILFCIIMNYALDENEKPASHYLLLSGPDGTPKCLPHTVHFVPISDGVKILFLLEVCNPNVAVSLYENFVHFHALQQIQIQREKDTLQPAVENLDLAVRKLNESFKKNKNKEVEMSHKELTKKWDIIRKKYQEYLKNQSDEALLRAETLAMGFLENLKELLRFMAVNESVLEISEKHAESSAEIMKEKLENFGGFFTAKCIKNFSLGSRASLTITKYLEQFPGLVHFLYINRTSHRVTTPTLDLDSEGAPFMKKKIWSMIDFSRAHLYDGNLSLMWKDTTFNYSYFVWFEDNSGTPLKPTAFPTNQLPYPGILMEDVYRKLKEICFPKISPSKIRCYELFCIHLGLVTTSCVLEQTRRLSATIWELRGDPSHAIDLF